MLSIPNISDDIIDALLLNSLPQPLELGGTAHHAALHDVVLTVKLTFRLLGFVHQRPWQLVQFVDRLRTHNTNNFFNTPLQYRPRIQHLVVVHPLDCEVALTESGSAMANYGLQRPLIRQTTTHFANLRTLVHDFSFPQHNLGYLPNSDAAYTRYHLIMEAWVGDVRGLQNGAVRLGVVMTDRFAARDDRSAEIDLRGFTNNRVAQAMIRNRGLIFRVV